MATSAMKPSAGAAFMALTKIANSPNLPPAVRRQALDRSLRHLNEATDRGLSPFNYHSGGEAAEAMKVREPEPQPEAAPSAESPWAPGNLFRPGGLGAALGLPAGSEMVAGVKDYFTADEGQEPQFPEIGWGRAALERMPGLGPTIDRVVDHWQHGPRIQPEPLTGLKPHDRRDAGWRETGMGLQPPLPEPEPEPPVMLHAQEPPMLEPGPAAIDRDLEGQRAWPPYDPAVDDVPIPRARPTQRADQAPAPMPRPEAPAYARTAGSGGRTGGAAGLAAEAPVGPPRELFPQAVTHETAAPAAPDNYGVPQFEPTDPSVPASEQGLAPWREGLLTAGLGMLASGKPFFQALGEGGLQGALAYRKGVDQQNQNARADRAEVRAERGEQRADHDTRLDTWGAGEDARRSRVKEGQADRGLGLEEQGLGLRRMGLEADIRQGDARLAQGARGLELEGARLGESRADRALRERLAERGLEMDERRMALEERRASQQADRRSAQMADLEFMFEDIKASNPGISPEQAYEIAIQKLQQLYGTKPMAGGLGFMDPSLMMGGPPPIDPNSLGDWRNN